MTKLLVKLFIKNSENASDTKVRAAYGRLSGITGIITNLFLFLIKFILGLVFSSVSVIADAVNNLSDSASSVIMLIGFKLSSKPPDKEHPFGHARIEYITGMVISFIIILIGWQTALSSFERIVSPVETEFTLVVILGLVFSVLIKIWQSVFYKSIGKKINSKAVYASSQDSLNDVISTTVVLLGGLISLFLNVNLDAYLGMAVALFIIYSGIRLIVETSLPLLGEAPNKQLTDDIERVILSHDKVIGFHDLMIHSYGESMVFASVHCEVPSEINVMDSHYLIDDIEKDIKEELGVEMTIHIDPIDTKDSETIRLKEYITEMVKYKYAGSDVHDFRIVSDSKTVKLVFDICIPFSQKDKDAKIIENIKNMILNLGGNYSAHITVDRIA